MTRDEIIAMLEARDPLAAAEGIAPPTEVGWMREPVDADGVVEVRYGAGTTPAQVADQLLAVARDASGARAVQLVPGDDSAERPGSWGNEDLLVTAHNDAQRKAEAAMQEKMQALTGGLGLPPGLGLG